MKTDKSQLLAAQIAASNEAARSLAHEIVTVTRELSEADAASVMALACCLSPSKPVMEALQCLRDGLADAAELIRDLPQLHAEAMADLRPATEAANARRVEIQNEINAMDRQLSQELAAIDRPIDEWNRWQRAGLTRAEMLARGAVEPTTQDPEVLNAHRQAVRLKHTQAVDQLVAERESLARFRNAPDPRTMPEQLRAFWTPPKALTKLLGAI